MKSHCSFWVNVPGYREWFDVLLPNFKSYWWLLVQSWVLEYSTWYNEEQHCLRLLLGLLEWLLESIQDCLKLGLWNAGLWGHLQWLRLHEIGNILAKAFDELLQKDSGNFILSCCHYYSPFQFAIVNQRDNFNYWCFGQKHLITSEEEASGIIFVFKHVDCTQMIN